MLPVNRNYNYTTLVVVPVGKECDRDRAVVESNFFFDQSLLCEEGREEDDGQKAYLHHSTQNNDTDTM